jgi:hypothetical protein
VRFLLIVIVILETLGKKGHSETLRIAGTADEEERETHQQHQQHPRQNVEAGLGLAHMAPLRECHEKCPQMWTPHLQDT